MQPTNFNYSSFFQNYLASDQKDELLKNNIKNNSNSAELQEMQAELKSYLETHFVDPMPDDTLKSSNELHSKSVLNDLLEQIGERIRNIPKRLKISRDDIEQAKLSTSSSSSTSFIDLNKMDTKNESASTTFNTKKEDIINGSKGSFVQKIEQAIFQIASNHPNFITDTFGTHENIIKYLTNYEAELSDLPLDQLVNIIHSTVKIKGLKDYSSIPNPKEHFKPNVYRVATAFRASLDVTRTDQFEKLFVQSEKTTELIGNASLSTKRNPNRYSDIRPNYPSRVILNSSRDYINANYVHIGPKKMIACQAPLECTIEDHFQMLSQENTKIVVKLTKDEEKGRPKAFGYSSNMYFGDICVFGKYTIECVSYERNDDNGSQIALEKRQLKIKWTDPENSSQQKSHEYTELFYHNWPDFGVPSTDISRFLWLCHMVDQSCEKFPESIPVIHCSAGIGRSGTFLAILSAIAQKKFGNELLNLALEMIVLRKYRQGSIQTEEQLKFAFDVIQAAFNNLDETGKIVGNDELQCTDTKFSKEHINSIVQKARSFVKTTIEGYNQIDEKARLIDGRIFEIAKLSKSVSLSSEDPMFSSFQLFQQALEDLQIELATVKYEMYLSEAENICKKIQHSSYEKVFSIRIKQLIEDITEMKQIVRMVSNPKGEKTDDNLSSKLDIFVKAYTRLNNDFLENIAEEKKFVAIAQGGVYSIVKSLTEDEKSLFMQFINHSVEEFDLISSVSIENNKLCFVLEEYKYEISLTNFIAFLNKNNNDSKYPNFKKILQFITSGKE